MVVQHNMTAMNANRMLGITTKTQAKSTEKLSSGYKINRAADDAAGLAISEKMRKQIRGLTQASANAEDGISAVQTAEGALTEVHDMLQRMNELAVKSANGTNSAADRQNIQDEIDQLVTEIDRVSTTTKFNETYLLKGAPEGGTVKTVAYKTTEAGIDAATGVTLYGADGKAVTGVTEKTIKDAVDSGNYFTGKAGDTKVTATSDVTGIVESDAAGTITYTGDKRVYTAAGEEIEEGDLATYFTAAADSITRLGTDSYTSIKGDGAAVEASFAEVAAATAKLYDAAGTEVAAADLADYFDETGKLKAANTLFTDNAGATAYTDGDAATYLETGDKVKALTLTLHVGADSAADNQIAVDIDAMSASGLGLLDDNNKLLVNGEDDTNALAAIDTIAEALKRVSTQRSALGAVQNRLEHTINNLDNVVENTTSAESQIRDTDMATEMVKYSNNQILSQAGQSMLAQGNQVNQGVLALLQ